MLHPFYEGYMGYIPCDSFPGTLRMFPTCWLLFKVCRLNRNVSVSFQKKETEKQNMMFMKKPVYRLTTWNCYVITPDAGVRGQLHPQHTLQIICSGCQSVRAVRAWTCDSLEPRIILIIFQLNTSCFLFNTADSPVQLISKKLWFTQNVITCLVSRHYIQCDVRIL